MLVSSVHPTCSSTAPASSSSISSSFASATGLASSRWCEKASQPIDSNLPDKGLGDHQLVPLNSSASNEFNAGMFLHIVGL